MKTIKRYIYRWPLIVLFLVFVLISCDKYLDVQPKGKRLLKTVADYDLWLNNSTDLAYAIPNELLLLEDVADNTTISIPYLGNNGVYTWQKQYTENPTSEPVIWKDFYKAIYYYNTVITGIDNATGGTEQQKKSLKAEALLGRAYSYLYLVNLYGKVYNSSTSSEDPAVPFVESNDLNDPTPPRSSVKEIYDNIISDLTAAIPDLPLVNSQNRFRGAKSSAYSILARTYLYMGDYANAALNAQLALENGPNTIQDYSALSLGNIGNLVNRPDVIYAKFLKSTYTQIYPTLSFLKTFNTKDLRLAFNYTYLDDYSFQTRGRALYMGIGVTYANAYPNCGTTVAEMRLIIAEAAARANDLPKAIQQLDLVRKCRFKAVDYIKYDPVNPIKEEVLQKILTERTFELAFNGMRWFDMRRHDGEGRMLTVNRYDGQGNIIATLLPHSNRYTLQIPLQVMYFNPGWTQNPWDNE